MATPVLQTENTMAPLSSSPLHMFQVGGHGMRFGQGRGVTEMRLEKQGRANRRNASLIFVVLALVQIGYQYDNLPNCIQTAKGFCAFAFPPNLEAQNICATQACRLYEYGVKNNIDWSKYLQTKTLVGIPSNDQSIPLADSYVSNPLATTTSASASAPASSSSSSTISWFTTYLSTFMNYFQTGGNDASGRDSLARGPNDDFQLNMNEESFDPEKFVEYWERQMAAQAFEEYGNSAILKNNHVDTTTKKMHTHQYHLETEWTGKHDRVNFNEDYIYRDDDNGYSNFPFTFNYDEANNMGDLKNGNKSPQLVACEVSCAILKDIAARRRCLTKCT